MMRHSTGTIRQRRPDVWEVRVCIGADPVSGQPVQRSVTVHGNLAEAERRRALLAAQAEQLRARGLAPLRTVAELLAVWLAAEHDWKPSTWEGYRHTARRLSVEPLARRAPAMISPPVLRTAMRDWDRAGIPISTSALWARPLTGCMGSANESFIPPWPSRRSCTARFGMLCFWNSMSRNMECSMSCHRLLQNPNPKSQPISSSEGSGMSQENCRLWAF
jgi:hypothetical protein